MKKANQPRKSTLGSSTTGPQVVDFAKKRHQTKTTTKTASPLQIQKKELQMHKKESRPKNPAQLVDIQA
jgi:hypothetical protein